jgi:deoxyadenosine/deoxycytidine kinase
MSKIAIDGNTCSGKTKCLQFLEHIGYSVHHNLSDPPELVQKYYADKKRYSFAYYMNRLHNYSLSQPSNQQIQIFEGSPYTLKHVYNEISFDKEELQLYNQYINELGWTPDLIIYLFCTPVVCYERAKQRDLNSPITLEHITDVHCKFETCYDELNCPITLYKINAQEDLDSVYGNIVDIINKLRFPS